VIRRFSRPVVALALVFAGLVVGQSSSPASAVGAPECQVWVASQGSQHIGVIDTWSSELSSFSLGETVSDLTFNRSGTKVFVSMQTRGVRMVDTTTYEATTVSAGGYTAGAASFGPIAASPTADYVVVVADDISNLNHYTTLNSETGAQIGSIFPLRKRSVALVFGPTGVAYSPELFSPALPNVIDVVDAAIPMATSTISAGLANTDSFTSAVVAAPSGHTPILFVGSSDNSNHFLRAIDTSTATLSAVVSLTQRPTGLAVTPAGDRLFVALANQNQVVVFDTITRNVVSTITVGSGPSGMAVTPDGRFLYVANQNSGSLSRVNLSTLTVDRTISVDPMPTKLAIGPAGCVSVEPQVAPSPSPVFAAASRVTMDPAGGVCVDDDVARREVWSSVFVGYRYLPGASDCTRSGFEFAGWARVSSPATVGAFPLLIDPSDGARRAFVAESAELVAVWTPVGPPPVAPSVFVALDGFFCRDCGVFLVWNDDVDDVIVMQDVHEVCVTGVVRIGEWSLCHDPTAPRGVLTYSLVATAGSRSSAPVVASVSR
jgi:YVTN family beta-propeller protein